MKRDSFISGISSTFIRERLLENQTLSFNQAYEKARALELKQTSETYSPHVVNSAQMQARPSTVDSGESSETSCTTATAVRQNKLANKRTFTCCFCGGRNWHRRAKCPAKDKKRDYCGKIGHYMKCCMGHKNATTSCVNSPCLSSLSTLHSSFPKHVITSVEVNDVAARALIDTGSTNSYLSKSFVDQNHINYTSLRFVANMANTSLITEIYGICNVKLQFSRRLYEQVEFFIMPDLVCDVIIGDDLLERHKSVTFQFNGKLPNLVVSSIMPTAQVEYPQLFFHMSPTCKPIAVKTRKFLAAEEELIKTETKRLLQEGRIEKSNSPWRAQPLIVDHGNGKKRMCIDYSQTVNLYTMLDAYPLPTIELIVNEVAKWKYISTLDLKSAYHLIRINPEDRPFTAFQSGNDLYQW